ncbi:unnamed protein product [Rhizoctonia solani]|uniref:Uncharacterized protein n=1 Tax=Rhizoctonia solani TaxID=456999 RepID=A0A8H2WEP3_9AGAM|nr:unnamed protein product [Rhizoctonia solani]
MLYWREQRHGRYSRTIKMITLPIRSATELGKTSTPKHQQDCEVVVGSKEHTGQPIADVPTLQYTIMGVMAACNNLTERGAINTAAKRSVLHSESGLASITEAAVFGTIVLMWGYSSLRQPGRASSALEETMVKDEPKILFRLFCLPFDSYEFPFDGSSTAEERAKIEEAVDAGAVWLDKFGSQANAKYSRLSATRLVETPIGHRYTEVGTRSLALQDLRNAMFTAKIIISWARENRTIIDAFNGFLESDPVGEHE